MPKSLVPNQFDYNGVYVEGERSLFRFHKPHVASFMSGMLVPLGDPIPCFPGVKANLLIDSVIRSNTLKVPPLDGMFIDFFTVWVPHRIVWTSMPQFTGENDQTAWTQSTTKVYPSIPLGTINSYFPNWLTATVYQGDVVCANLFLAPHYGLVSKSTLATDIAAVDINVLSMRGYFSIWNHFFRDENYQRPVLFSKGDNGSSGEFGYLLRDYQVSSGSTATSQFSLTVGSNAAYTKALLMPVNKFHDFATSVLPQPQFGGAAVIGMAGRADVKLSADEATLSLAAGSNLAIHNVSALTTSGATSNVNVTGSGYSVGTALQSGLWADLSTATAITINQLRASVMTQRYLEALARGGRRVPEYYNVIYGVKNSQATKDYPQMLSHQRYILGVNQVVATADSSGSGWTSHLGDTGAYSLTNLRNIPCCEFEASEFGYLHILYCVRADNRYSQAIPQHFTRSVLLDEYNPYFDHVGDFDVPNYLVNMDASTKSNWGYQEAWWFERTQVGLCVGAVNRSYGSLAYWSLGEVLPSSQITCTPGYLCFSPEVFNDVFVSYYYTYPQFIIDACIHGKVAKRMSQHSIPGIVGRI